MNPIDLNSRLYTDFGIENNDIDPRYKVDDYVRISKYKNAFAKGYVPNWSEELLVTKKVTCCETYCDMDICY